MKKLYLIVCILFVIVSLFAYHAEVNYNDSWNKPGLSIEEQNTGNLKLNYSINNFRFEEVLVDNENLTNILLPGVFLPNDEGMPNLPGSGRYIAIPQDAKAELHIIDYRIERYYDIDIVPAPRIPLDTEDGPLEYTKNNEIYTRNANYPENFIQLSEPSKLRGVDVVMLGITPFQYNPVSKELIVYRDIEFEVNFSGGNGHFGEDRLRSRWWDPVIKDAILNSSILPEIDFNSREVTRDGAEYLIICPDDQTFLAWADSIKIFRQQQGISTMIKTTEEIGGNTRSAIENYVETAYYNWSTSPSAVLLLGDYGSIGNTVMSSDDITHPYSGTYVTDNVFADVDGDGLPEMAFARMTAQTSTHLDNMISKFLEYEREPPMDSYFYDNPITACGWQTERWFQICSESIYGFWENELSKNPVRINNIYDGTPGSDWSTATNTATVVNYFGPSADLGYIPATPNLITDWNNGSAALINSSINSGAFMLQHRDHGGETGWGEPDYGSSDLSGLGNNDPIFVMSINCLTGRFDYGSEVFAEAFHRMEYGALGLIAASQVSYSFVNDVYVWGLYDNMWTNFMPDYGTTPESRGILPAFGNVAGKFFLQQSSWPYNTSSKAITYNLFHHHGDAFSTVYSEVPQPLTVSHSTTLLANITSFSVTANAGSFIALTVNNEIIGTADGTGSPVEITIPAQNGDYDMLVTVTKQNYLRNKSIVDVIPLAPDITVTPLSYSETLSLSATQERTLSITNDGEIGSILNYSLVIENDTRSTNSNLNYKAFQIKEKLAKGMKITPEEYSILKVIENKRKFISPTTGRDEATCYPSSSAYWSGSTTSSAKTDGEARAYGGGESGWVMFDVSAIPDDAAITSIVFNFYVNDTNWPYWSTTPVSSDPVTTSAATLYNDINAENTTGYYNYQNESSGYAIGWKNLTLGGGANTDLFNQLTDDWFAIGISSRDASSTYYLEIDGWNQTNAPYIVVNYTPNIPVLVITSPNGSEVWANGESCDITWDHSGAALTNVKLELSTNNGTDWDDIIASTLNDGTHEWTVSGTASEECLVRVSDPSESTTNDVSNAVFRIYDTVNWLTIDQNNGSLNQGSSDNLTLTFDTSGLLVGTYNARIEVSSNDPVESIAILPVTLTVSGQLDPPVNVQAHVVGIDVLLSWDAVPGATAYHVYSSLQPYSGYTELDLSLTNSYEHIGGATSTSLFYFITAE